MPATVSVLNFPMATHPFLLFPRAAAPEKKANLPLAVVPKVATPSAARQRERLEQKFADIVAGFDQLQPTIEGIEPERVVVFETKADSVTEFARAAAGVEGLEWVADLDLGDAEADDDFRIEGDAQKRLSARLYAVMTNQKAIQDLLSLWGRWLADPDQSWNTKGLRGFGPFKDVFRHLTDIRRWGPRDRVEHTGSLTAWEENLQFAAQHARPHEPAVRFEVELWCRSDPPARQRAYATLSAIVSAAGGRCLTQAAIPEIFYHGVLAELPVQTIRETITAIQSNQYTDLVRCEAVMFFRPRAQSAFPLGDPGVETVPHDYPNVPAAALEPLIAVLDGVPLRNHELLRNKLRIDDPDDLASRYEPRTQQHGTAMCSLILNGDLSLAGTQLTRPLYLRPILIPATDFNGQYIEERTRDDELLIDLFHRAIRRIVEADGAEPAAAPSVRVVNLSFGNRWQPFDRQCSPLARLLDWLAWKYRLLFLVSAGNQGQDITIQVGCDQWSALEPEALRDHVIRAMRDDQVQRRPFSPAEAMNAVTVGAWHEDGCVGHANPRTDLFKDSSLPSPFSTIAAGYDQSVKPEVYFPGGRQLYRASLTTAPTTTFSAVPGIHAPGLKVAAPGVAPMELNRTFYSRGTSDATALASRAVGLAYERIQEYRKAPGWERLSDEFTAVLLKALLVHGAAWGPEKNLIEAAIPPDDLKGDSGRKDWQKLQRIHNRFLGCGKVDTRRVQHATDERATVLAWDELLDEQSHVYALPLPPTLASKKFWRRLTVTLAWLSPVNPQHRNYRKAMLWADLGVITSKTVEKNGKSKKERTQTAGEELLLVQKAGLDLKTSQRGTVQHRVWEGEHAAVYGAEEFIQLRVSCRADAGKLQDAVPYALAVSLEVAEGIGVPVYQEVRQGLLVPIKPRPR
jgi:hypothetical protein